MPDIRPPIEVLPHRPPHLWLDRVTLLEPDQAAGEWTPGPEHFDGHFPDMPILPGVKQVESAAQLGAFLLLHDDAGDTLPIFGGIERVQFLNPVVPGSRLDLFVKMLDRTKRDFRGEISASVGDNMTMEGSITGKIIPTRLFRRMQNLK